MLNILLQNHTTPFVNISSVLHEMQSVDNNCLAKKYSQLNDHQTKVGKDFISSLSLKHGDRLRVLDMGCGTGELTAFIAETLGDNSQIIGVDPILERISIARNKHSRENLTFIHGDSSSEFPGYNEACYDLHFSNFVVNWLAPKEKEIFFNTAFRILKPGGTLAILSYEGSEIRDAALALLLNHTENNSKQPVPDYLVNKAQLEDLSRQAGFAVISNVYKPTNYRFVDLDYFLNWMRATFYISHSELCQRKMEKFVQRYVNQDGTVTFTVSTIYQLIAKKPE